METEAYIALGSNVGDRELNLLRAVAEVGGMPDCKVTALSSFYVTSPVGMVNQSAFYNAVLRLSTRLDAQSLLSHLMRIEDAVFKRVRTVHQGPRRMDLDILLYSCTVINTANLVIPHPRLAERRFVLQPLCEIAPDFVHPLIGKPMHEILAELSTEEVVVKL